MPAALAVNWTEIQMLALTYGVREAARMMGISEESVLQRSSREGWIKERKACVPLPPTMKQPAVIGVINTPISALQNRMREDAIGGRAAQLKLGRKTLEELAEKPVSDLLTPEMSQVAKNYGSLHAQAAGYGAQDATARLNLRVTADRSSEIPATVEAEWTEGIEDKGFTDTF